MPRPHPYQSHKVANRNARAGAAPPQEINVSVPGTDHRSVFDLEGRLTLVQERKFDWKVKAQIADRPAPDLESIRDPINQTGPLHSACIPAVMNNDPISYLAAVNKRSNFMQAPKNDNITDEMFEHALRIIDEIPDGYFDIWMENDIDRNRWLAKFDQGKQTRMKLAWDDVDKHTLQELRTKNGSVKIEALQGKRFDESAAGRIIYAGTDAFNAVTGPPMMIAMERLVELLAKEVDGDLIKIGGVVQCLLGYKADDIKLADFIKDDRYRDIVEGDFSRNDREQRQRVALLIDRWFQKLGLPIDFRTLTLALEKYVLVNVEFGIKVHLMYQLATGTTNTTFRNSCYNLTMFAVTCRIQKRRGKALILGDDLLAALNKRLDLKEWTLTVADFKMVLKAKAPKLDGEATFLSRRIFADVETPFMIPLLGKMLVKFNTRSCQNAQLSDSRAMAAKALSYAYGCRYWHKLRDIFYQRYLLEMAKPDDTDEFLSVQDLGWNTRQFGHTLEDIKRLVTDSPNLVDDDQASFWLTNVYDIDLYDTLEIFEDTVLSDELTILEDVRIEKFRVDYD